MLVKALNYNLAFVPDLLALYPDARFVGLIRDGRAVCEGHVARGAGLADAAAAYAYVGRRLIELEARGLPLKTWRFEDLARRRPGRQRRGLRLLRPRPRRDPRASALQDKERIVQPGRPRRRHAQGGALLPLRGDGPAHARRRQRRRDSGGCRPEALAEITDRCRAALAHFGYLAATRPQVRKAAPSPPRGPPDDPGLASGRTQRL